MTAFRWLLRRLARALSPAFVALTLIVAAPARADETVIAPVLATTAVSAYGGHLVWSARDTVTGGYAACTPS